MDNIKTSIDLDWYKKFGIKVIESIYSWEDFHSLSQKTSIRIEPEEYAFRFSDSDFEWINKSNGIVDLLTYIEKCVVAGYSQGALFSDIQFDGYVKTISLTYLKAQLLRVFPIKRLDNEIKELKTKNKDKKLIFVRRIPWEQMEIEKILTDKMLDFQTKLYIPVPPEYKTHRFSLYGRFGFGVVQKDAKHTGGVAY